MTLDAAVVAVFRVHIPFVLKVCFDLLFLSFTWASFLSSGHTYWRAITIYRIRIKHTRIHSLTPLAPVYVYTYCIRKIECGWRMRVFASYSWFNWNSKMFSIVLSFILNVCHTCARPYTFTQQWHTYTRARVSFRSNLNSEIVSYAISSSSKITTKWKSCNLNSRWGYEHVFHGPNAGHACGWFLWQRMTPRIRLPRSFSICFCFDSLYIFWLLNSSSLSHYRAPASLHTCILISFFHFLLVPCVEHSNDM